MCMYVTPLYVHHLSHHPHLGGFNVQAYFVVLKTFSLTSFTWYHKVYHRITLCLLLTPDTPLEHSECGISVYFECIKNWVRIPI